MGCSEEKYYLAAYHPMRDFEKQVCSNRQLLSEYRSTWPKIRSILEGANKCEQRTYTEVQRAQSKGEFCSQLEAMTVCIKSSFQELTYAFSPQLVNSYMLFRLIFWVK